MTASFTIAQVERFKREANRLRDLPANRTALQALLSGTSLLGDAVMVTLFLSFGRGWHAHSCEPQL